MIYKDAAIDLLAQTTNVAQFASFAPSGRSRFSRILGYEPNYHFAAIGEAIEALLKKAADSTVNLRTFLPESPQSNPFIYGLSATSDILERVEGFLSRGFYVIINETIDVNDGGVSGVIQNGIVEFAPGVIPRFVEKGGKDIIPSLPINFASSMLKTVYQAEPDFGGFDSEFIRGEFSFHPKPRGFSSSHTIFWEVTDNDNCSIKPFYGWPSGFSRYLGDKAYGLLCASLFDFPVPYTQVYPRNRKIKAFSFGKHTGSLKKWTRTCPHIPEPGLYATYHSEMDPFELMQTEDPEEKALASCIVQDDVGGLYSGAVITDVKHQPVLEGAAGLGDTFMMGIKRPSASLPPAIVKDVLQLYYKIYEKLGPIGMEWVHDGEKPWLLQLHLGESSSSGRTIVPGTPKNWVKFDVNSGLAKLRDLIFSLQGTDTGIYLTGNPGLTSHIADVLRKNQIPSVIL